MCIITCNDGVQLIVSTFERIFVSNTAGSGTIAIPPYATRIMVECWGGGGAGGNGTSTGAGGGGGAYARSVLNGPGLTSAPSAGPSGVDFGFFGNTLYYSIGAGGIVTAGAGQANNGGNTWVSTYSTVEFAGPFSTAFVKANGGIRGLVGAGSLGGPGGTIAACVFNDRAYAGGAGADAQSGGGTRAGSGGGGSAGSNANGSIGTSGSGATAGLGGSRGGTLAYGNTQSFFGSDIWFANTDIFDSAGANGANGATNARANTGFNPGGGGGGGFNGTTAPGGGNGANGLLIVYCNRPRAIVSS